MHALGRALSGLSGEGILLAGSGSTTHNLGDIRAEGTPPADWAQTFDTWIDEGLNRGDITWFANMDAAPDYRHAHPTDEHFLPLFFAMGAAGQDASPELLHRSYSHGSISMSYFRFPVAKAA